MSRSPISISPTERLSITSDQLGKSPVDERLPLLGSGSREPSEDPSDDEGYDADLAADGYVQSSGVTRMEAVTRAASGQTGRKTLFAVGASILLCAWAYSLDQATTPLYSILATSHFSQHGNGLAELSIATNIISAVSKPFVAKISDITSRPYTYTLVLVFYVTGYLTAALSGSLNVYIVGEVCVAIGSAGLDLLNEVIVGDLTPLEWRGFAGAFLSLPFIVNTWFAGKIVQALSEGEKWRWGYAMFAIILPAVLGPAIVTLITLDRKAQRLGLVNMASSNAARRDARTLAEAEGYEGPSGRVPAKAAYRQDSWSVLVRRALLEIDAFGLLLLGVGWSFILLPFSMKVYRNGGLGNPTFLFFEAAGLCFLASYAYYEKNYAPVPSAPRRLVFNRTFICAVIIDVFYFVAGMMRALYFTSFVYIVKDWSMQNVTYFSNLMTICLCLFGLLAGALQRWTHRYKHLQIMGLSFKILGMFLLVRNGTGEMDTWALILQQILIGGGGAFSVVGSRVAAQASVPHQDLALTAALLSLLTKIGAASGSAIAYMVYASKMPNYLRHYMPSDVTDEQIEKFFGDPKLVRDYPYDDPIRQAAINAFRDTVWYLFVPALILSFVPLIAACFQTNYYLGTQQNAVMNVGTDGRRVSRLSVSGDDDTGGRDHRRSRSSVSFHSSPRSSPRISSQYKPSWHWKRFLGR